MMMMLACNDPARPGGKDAATCTVAGLVEDPTVTFSERVATVGALDLTVNGPADVTVTLTAEGAPTVETMTWTDLSGAVTLPLYGLRPDTTYTAEIVATSADGCGVEEVEATTGMLPAFVPEAATVLTEGDTWGTYTLVGWIDVEDDKNTGALIFDEGGVVVWFWLAPRGVAANATWAAEGNFVLVRSDDRANREDAAFYRIDMDGQVLEEHIYADAHHDIGQAPDISFAFLRAVSREIDGEPVTGDEIVELGLDGTTRVVWNAFDCMATMEHHHAWNGDTAPIPGHDWTHVNHLSYCEADDTWLISTYYLHEVHKIRRTDCSDVWVLDGDGTAPNGFEIADPAWQFGPQHAPLCTDDGIVLFDNGASPSEVSRGISFALDEETRVATALWTTPHPEGAQTPALGSTQALPDGSTLLGWGALGEVSVIDAQGDIQWHVALDHAILGSTERRESLYGP